MARRPSVARPWFRTDLFAALDRLKSWCAAVPRRLRNAVAQPADYLASYWTEIDPSRLQKREGVFKPQVHALELRMLPTTLPGVTEYAAGGGGPVDIMPDPHTGRLMYANFTGGQLGRIDTSGTTVVVPLGITPADVSVSEDGTAWATGWSTPVVLRINPDNSYLSINIPGSGDQPNATTIGPDGFLWFTTFGGDRVGKIDPTSNLVYEYPVTSGSLPTDIVAGPGGHIWFTELGTGKVAEMSLDGVILNEYALGSGTAPFGLALGADGNIYVADNGTAQVSRVTPGGGVVTYSLPGGAAPSSVTQGPDGTIWVAESGIDKVANINASGAITQFELPSGSSPTGITTLPGTDTIWITEFGGNKIARIDPVATITGWTSNTGSSDTDFITTDTTPTITGTANPNATVTLDGLDATLTTTADAAGNWSITIPTSLDDGTHVLTAQATIAGLMSPLSAPTTITVDTTPPEVELSVQNVNGGVRPTVSVTPTDAVGFPALTTVSLDVDLNNDGDFTDSGETDYATATLVAGVATFNDYTPLTADTTVRFQARVTDLAGNEGDSEPTSKAIATINLLKELSVSSGPVDIMPDPSTGGLAYVDFYAAKLGRVTAGGSISELDISKATSTPADIVVTEDGTAWVSGWDTPIVARVAPDDSITTIAISGLDDKPNGLAIGPDGFIWFTTFTGNRVGKIDPEDNTVTEYDISGTPLDIVAGPDGKMWVTEYGAGSVIQMSTSGSVLATYTLGDGTGPWGIAPGGDGKIYVADNGSSQISVITIGGAVTSYTLDAGSGPWSVTQGPDGSVWFAESGTGKLGRIETDGTITEVEIPTSGSMPTGITSLPATSTSAGSIWATEFGGAKLVRLEPIAVIQAVKEDSGFYDTDAVTNDATPTLLGSAIPNSTITISSLGTTTAGSDGLWSFTPSTLADGDYTVSVTSSILGLVSLPATVTLTVDTTPPELVVLVDSPTSSQTPEIAVTATDLGGFLPIATVTLDVDLNNDGDFLDEGESGYAMAALEGGTATFDSYPPLPLGTTVNLQARITDLAGNEGTSEPVPLVINPPERFLQRVRSPYGGMAGWTTPTDALGFLGNVTAVQTLDLDDSPNPVRGVEPALVYNSQEASPTPIIQVTLPATTALGIPESVTGSVTWDGLPGSTTDYDLRDLLPTGGWIFSAVGPMTEEATATGAHTFTLSLFLDYPGTENDHPLLINGRTYLVNRSEGPYGAGWSFSDVDTLVTIAADDHNPAGVLREFGGGGWAFYEETLDGYLSPPGDAGTLTWDAGGGTYTAWDGEVETFNSAGEMTSWKSPNGVDVVTYTYDASGGVASVSSPDGSVSTFNYSGSQVSSIDAPGSRETTLSHSGHNLTQVTDPAGDVQQFAYASGRLTSSSHGVEEMAYSYDTNGLAQTVQLGDDPAGLIVPAVGAGLVTAAMVEGGGIPGSFTDGRGAETLTSYDEFGQPVRVHTFNGATETIDRDGNGWVTSMEDPLGRTTSFTVNERGQVLEETRADGTSASWNYDGPNGSLLSYTDFRNTTTTYTRDSVGEMTSMTDPMNHTTTYNWASGLLVNITDALNEVTTETYDAFRRFQSEIFGGVTQETELEDADGDSAGWTDALGKTTSEVNDKDGRPLTITDPDGNTTTYTYDDSGLLLSMEDADGHVTSYGYDSVGRQVVVITAFGTALAERTTSVYDAVGNLIQSVDPAGKSTTYRYDFAGNLIDRTDPLGYRTSYSYDLDNEEKTMTDARGKVTRFGYDLLGRQTSVTDPMNKVTGTNYDADSNITGMVDARSKSVTEVYDAANRLTETIDEDGNITTYLYDALDRQTGMIDQHGNFTQTVYDSRGRVSNTIDGEGYTTTYTYDDDNRLISTIDADGRITTNIYDDAGRRVGTVDAADELTSYVFDKAGNLVRVIDPLNHSNTEMFDDQNRPYESIDALGNITTTVYDSKDRVIAMIDALGDRTTTVYDDDDRVIETIDALGQSTTYAYDQDGNLLSTTDPMGRVSQTVYDDDSYPIATVDALGNRTTTVYDDDHRITGTIDPLGHTTETVYDDAGRVIATVDALGHRTTTVYHDDENIVETIDAIGRITTSVYDDRNELVETIDPMGFLTTAVYDPSGLLEQMIDARGKVTELDYDAAGRESDDIDPNHHDTETIYDDAGRVLATVDGAGKRTTYGYDAADRQTSVMDPDGRVTTTVYDALGRVVATIDPTNKITTTVYDALGRVVEVIDPLNQITTTVYNADSEVIETIDAKGKIFSMDYDDDGRLIDTIDPVLDITTTVYDAAGRVIETIDALGRSATTAYDAANRVISTTDERGKTTFYGYDAVNRQITVTTPDGKTTTTVYDADDRVIATIDPLGLETDYAYDQNGNLRSVTDPLGKITTETYDDAGNVIAQTDPLGRTTTTVYDEDNRVIARIDPLGNFSTTVYDDAGQVIETIDARGTATDYEYDIDGRQTEVIDALGNITTTVYDDDGQVVATIDPLGNETTYAYDQDGNQVSRTDPLGHVTSMRYDDADRVIATVDALGNTTTTVYDKDSRVIATIDPLGFITTSTYDNDGNRVGMLDASGNLTTWAFDSMNRLIGETDSLGHTSTMAYDNDSRLVSETDRDGRRRDFAYDNDGRMTTEKWYTAGGSLIQTQTWTYDDAGQRLTAQDPDGTYTFTYDGAGRVSTVAEPFGLTLAFGYDEVGNRTSVVDSQGGVTTVVFDDLNRQTSEEVGGSGISAMRFDYGYDDRGMRTSLTRYSDLAGTSVVGTTVYDYDAAGREIHEESTDGTGSVLANYTYTFDAADRLTSRVEDGTTTTYQYDDASQLTQDGGNDFSYDSTGNRTNSGYSTGTGNRITTDGVWTYTFDAEGNLTKKSQGASADTWVYSYDNRNQMTSAIESATDGGAATQRVTYVYDALGNRIESDSWDGSTTTVQRYGMDGWDPSKPSPVGNENFDTWVQLDGSNALVRRRVTGTGADEQIARQTAGGVVNWYLADRQGSVREVIDNSGTVQATSTFDAFGNLTSGSLSDRFGYQGMEFDGVTGDYFDRARVYDPGIGQFTSEDVKFPESGSNAFEFAGNGPTNASDPSGKDLFAVGTDARDEALWHLENTYGLNRSLEISVIDLGVANDSIWEKTKADQHVYLIAPQPGGLRSRGVEKQPRLANEADAAVREMWQAFWYRDVRRFVGVVDPNTPPKGQTQWPGMFHKRPASLDHIKNQFYIGTQFDTGLIFKGDETEYRAKLDFIYGLEQFKQLAPTLKRLLPERGPSGESRDEQLAMLAIQSALQAQMPRLYQVQPPVTPMMTAQTPEYIEFNKRLQEDEKQTIERDKRRAFVQRSMLQVPGYEPDWRLLDRVNQQYMKEDQEREFHMSPEQKQLGEFMKLAFSFVFPELAFPRLAAGAVVARTAKAESNFIGGVRIGQTDLSGLPNTRNLTLGRLQGQNSTCGLHAAGSVIEDVNPTHGPLNVSLVRGQIRANGGAGLNQAEVMGFLERNLPDTTVVVPGYGVDEAALGSYLNRGHVIAGVEGNHWVRVLGTVEENGETWVRIYDPARGRYDQLLSSFMTRMYRAGQPAGYHNVIISIRPN